MATEDLGDSQGHTKEGNHPHRHPEACVTQRKMGMEGEPSRSYGTTGLMWGVGTARCPSHPRYG